MHAIPASTSKKKVLHCRNINEFTLALKQTLLGLGIVFIVVRNQNELNEIYRIRERLQDHAIIMIVADDVADMPKKILRLYPRYTTHIKNEYNDVLQVLTKMVDNIQNKMKGEKNGRIN